MATYALHAPNPVRSDNLAAGPRFEPCEIMDEHGIASGVMAKIRGHGKLFGLLGEHSGEPRDYDQDEVLWLADVASMLGGGLGRGRLPLTGTEDDADADADADLDDALERIAAPAAGGGALVETARVAASNPADWCFVDLPDEGRGSARTIRGIAIGASRADERGRRLAREPSYPLDPGAAHGTPKVLRAGEHELIRRVDDAVLRRGANDPVHLGTLRDLDQKSYLVVPIHLDLRPVGNLVPVSTDSSRLFDRRALHRATPHPGALPGPSPSRPTPRVRSWQEAAWWATALVAVTAELLPLWGGPAGAQGQETQATPTTTGRSRGR